MALRIEKKKEIVCELQERFREALSVVVASLDGVTSNLVNKLRKEARSIGVYMRVVPNTLLNRAVCETSYTCLSEFFVGKSIIAFSTRNPNDAARVLIEFSKEYDKLKIKGASFEGKLIRSDQISLLSNLPDYKESILQFILMLKIISIGNLIGILRELSGKKV